jgi:probable phosphoglycerate mutase
MTTFLLIRHATNDYLTRQVIAGRLPGVRLNDPGRRQAEVLAERVARFRPQRLFSSPLERARETAEPCARKLGLPVETLEALNEVDFGDWTGRPVTELDALEGWRQWNHFRSGVRIPNGETMLEIQARLVSAVQKLHRDSPGARLALFSHGDPVRAVLAYFLGMPLDCLLRMDIRPASVSVLTLTDWGAQVTGMNLVEEY